MEAVLVDTGAIVALLNADDLLHRQARLISYIDGTSVAVMERLGVTEIFTFDPFFKDRGFRPLTVTGSVE